jgi:hypothetical protein
MRRVTQSDSLIPAGRPVEAPAPRPQVPNAVRRAIRGALPCAVGTDVAPDKN